MDLSDHQEIQELRVSRVVLEPLDQQDHWGRMEMLDLTAYLVWQEEPEDLVDPDPKVQLVHLEVLGPPEI